MDKLFYNYDRFIDDIEKFFNVDDLYNANESAINEICSLENVDIRILQAQIIKQQIEIPFVQPFLGLDLFKKRVFNNDYCIITGAGKNDKTTCINISHEERSKDVIYELIFREIKYTGKSVSALKELFKLVPAMKKLKIHNLMLETKFGVRKNLKEINVDKINVIEDDFNILNPELFFTNVISIHDYTK